MNTNPSSDSDPQPSSKKEASESQRVSENDLVSQIQGAMRHFSKEELVASVVLIIGVIVSFYWTGFGSLLEGCGIGYVFAEWVTQSLKSVKKGQEYSNTIFKTIVIICSIIYMIVVIPFFILGMVLGVLLDLLIHWQSTES